MPVIKFLKGKGGLHSPPLLYGFLLLFALFSALGLDYIGWKKGEKSYLFSSLGEKDKDGLRNEDLHDIIQKSLSRVSIPVDSINQYLDKEGIHHSMVDIKLQKYSRLEAILEEEFKKIDLIISKKEEQQTEEKIFHLWEVNQEERHRMTILFSCLKEKPEEGIAKNKVAIIVDDMGYSLKAINEICSLKKPITIAILPFSPLAQETARIAKDHKLEVILHLPLESLPDPEANNNIKGIIHSRMSEEEVREALEENIKQVPYIVGVNNHMGSKITADARFMNIILTRLKESNLYFIDSLTTGNSIASSLARDLKIPSATRHIFIDAENDEVFIKNQLLSLFRLAQQNGKAIGICHPGEKTLRILAENIYLIEEYDLQPVYASQLVN